MQFETTLAHSTVRLEVTKDDGRLIRGTGFLVRWVAPHNPVLSYVMCVTNRHLLAGAQRLSVAVTFCTSDGGPDYGNGTKVDILDIGKIALFHPNSQIDLAAFSFSAVLNSADHFGRKVFFRMVNRGDIPTDQVYSILGVADDILMVGYPDGLFDSHNNMPIVRRGITATTPALKFNSRPEFVVDVAVFPGSSGSPVWLNQPMGYEVAGTIHLGSSRRLLIGVLYAGYGTSADGEILPQAIPTIAKAASMMHLGFCIRASEIACLTRR